MLRNLGFIIIARKDSLFRDKTFFDKSFCWKKTVYYSNLLLIFYKKNKKHSQSIAFYYICNQIFCSQ